MNSVRSFRLLRGSALNVAGQVLPLAAALVAIPGTIVALGAARFGILSLAWALIGAFSLFDLGLGRALTQLVSAEVTRGRSTAPPVTRAGLALMGMLGVVAGIGLLAVTPQALPRVLPGSPDLYPEVRRAVWWLALGIPAVLVTGGFAGVLTAFHQFGRLNALRIPIGMLAFLVPWAIVVLYPTLPAAVAALVLVRVSGLLAHWAVCRPLLPRASERADAGSISALMSFGAWMTVSNLISPLLLYLDRFAIATLVSAVAVAHYAAPYDVVTRLLLVTGAVSGVLFPAFASVSDRPEALRRLLGRGVALVTGMTLPALTAVVALAPELLTRWLGAEFAREGAPVARLLAVGVAANCVAQVCAALIHGLAKPRLTAAMHLVELPLYLVALWLGVWRFGVIGAALAWTVRVCVDSSIHAAMAWRLVGGARREMIALFVVVPLAALTVALPALPGALTLRVVVALTIAAAWALLAWWAWRRLEEGAERPSMKV